MCQACLDLFICFKISNMVVLQFFSFWITERMVPIFCHYIRYCTLYTNYNVYNNFYCPGYFSYHIFFLKLISLYFDISVIIKINLSSEFNMLKIYHLIENSLEFDSSLITTRYPVLLHTSNIRYSMVSR